jgi:hypothetical protein
MMNQPRRGERSQATPSGIGHQHNNGISPEGAKDRSPRRKAWVDGIKEGSSPEGAKEDHSWYILPLAACHGSFDVWLTPHHKNSRYAQYKDAWHLLKR